MADAGEPLAVIRIVRAPVPQRLPRVRRTPGGWMLHVAGIAVTVRRD